MSSFYETGLGIAFMLWLAGIVMTLVSINSTMERNLNRIGQRLSWFTLRPKAMDAEEMKHSAFRKIFKFLLIYKRTKDAGAPQAVREFRWKMKNVDMPFDQIVREMVKVSGEESDSFEKMRSDLVQEMTDRGFTIV